MESCLFSSGGILQSHLDSKWSSSIDCDVRVLNRSNDCRCVVSSGDKILNHHLIHPGE